MRLERHGNRPGTSRCTAHVAARVDRSYAPLAGDLSPTQLLERRTREPLFSFERADQRLVLVA